jgi:glutamate racemase
VESLCSGSFDFNYLYGMSNQPIGVFDSGYGGLTVFKSIVAQLPAYDYLYLGDNARSPYGPRSFETVYAYTLQCVRWFFDQGCPLVILACNTASAKALRTIQQKDLPLMGDSNRRVLGVIRPTTEVIGNYTTTGKVGILGTKGTIVSNSYPIEIEKFWPGLQVYQQACPMWVPLVENNEHLGDGADYFVKEYLQQLFDQCSDIDTLLLACTHYPLLKQKITQWAPAGIQLVSQGDIVAQSLQAYITRHPAMKQRISAGGQRHFFTTDDVENFNEKASIFFGEKVSSSHAVIY